MLKRIDSIFYFIGITALVFPRICLSKLHFYPVIYYLPSYQVFHKSYISFKKHFQQVNQLVNQMVFNLIFTFSQKNWLRSFPLFLSNFPSESEQLCTVHILRPVQYHQTRISVAMFPHLDVLVVNFSEPYIIYLQ